MEVSISAVIAQIINFWIMFWLFNRFAAKPLAQAIEDRKKLLAKLENADKAYDEKLEIAKLEAKEIVQEWMERKDKLIAEVWILADQKRDTILASAKVQATKILDTAEPKTKVLEAEIERSFIDWVKRTSLLVIKKLIKKDTSIQKDYLDEALKEVIK